MCPSDHTGLKLLPPVAQHSNNTFKSVILYFNTTAQVKYL